MKDQIRAANLISLRSEQGYFISVLSTLKVSKKQKEKQKKTSRCSSSGINDLILSPTHSAANQT